MIEKAKAAFQKVMARAENNPIGWVARAWYGRCFAELTDNARARAEYAKIIAADSRAKEAKRLARYFDLLAAREKPEKNEGASYIIRRANDWIADYHAYLNTPEGYGLRFLLAKVYFQETQRES